jgi:hypothetical protein
MEIERAYDLWIFAACGEFALFHIDHRIVLSVGMRVQRRLVFESFGRLLALLIYKRELVDVLWPETQLDYYMIIKINKIYYFDRLFY